jgi:hypothetical protein
MLQPQSRRLIHWAKRFTSSLIGAVILPSGTETTLRSKMDFEIPKFRCGTANYAYQGTQNVQTAPDNRSGQCVRPEGALALATRIAEFVERNRRLGRLRE